MNKVWLLVGGLLFAPWALAGGSAVLQDGTRIDFEGERVRMTMSGDADGRNEMIYRDGKAYAVQGSAVYDLSQMMPAVMGAVSGAGDVQGSPDQTRVHMRDSGRSESVAGISGKVYIVESVDERGQVERTEMVLSRHPLAVELTRAMTHVATGMAGADARVWTKGPLDNQGVLRVEQDFVLSSLKAQRFADAHFALPAKPQAIPGMNGMMLSSQGGDMPVTDPISRQPERARSRIDSEINNAADRAVDRAMDQMLRGLIP